MKNLLLALAGLLAMGSASAHIYKTVTPEGRIVYSDRPSDQSNVSISVIKAAVVSVATVAPAAAPASRASQPQTGGLIKVKDGVAGVAAGTSGPRTEWCVDSVELDNVKSKNLKPASLKL